MNLKIGKLLRGGVQVVGFLLLFCFVSYLHRSVRNRAIENNGKQAKQVFRYAFKNRNIASFYDETIEASEQLAEHKRFQFVRNLKPYFPNYIFQKPINRGNVVGENKDESHNDDITLDDVYISVKTSKKYHQNRLQIVIDTWFQQARNQTYFFTDDVDPYFDKLTAGHIVNTRCKDSHTRHDLSCKMAAEYDGFMKSFKRWWCHFDDDNYVNVDQLVALLRQHSWRKDVYLGKPSLNHPFYVKYKGKKEEIWFATGGAGVCISSSLAQKMAPWCRNGELTKTSDALRIPDDCTLGFVVSNRLSVNLTQSDLLHSHLERLKEIQFSSIKEQVTLSYHLGDENHENLISIPDTVRMQEDDPTRIKTLHCYLHPTASLCR